MALFSQKTSACLVAAVALCGCERTLFEEIQPANSAPDAALRAPVIAPVGAPVVLDASASTDDSGDPLTFTFDIVGFGGEGSNGESIETVSSAIEYTFPSAGIYTVLVHVMDIHGSEGLATQDVTVRDEYPVPPNFCGTAEDCVVGDECDAGVCFTNGGAIE